VIYLDTSVALAHLLAEDVTPPVSLWRESLVTCRLLEYELWTRLHARGLARSHGDAARELVQRLALLEMVPEVLARALEPFPAPVRTLDALHLAAVEFLRRNGQAVVLATYDARQRAAAEAMGVPLAPLSQEGRPRPDDPHR
jgi:predicted nucleic acid-binding protein